MNRTTRRKRQPVQTIGTVIDWHTAPEAAQQATRDLIRSRKGGEVLLASGMRFAVVALEANSAGAFMVGVADPENVPLAVAGAHERMGELYHRDGGATQWALFVDDATRQALMASLRDLVLH